MELCIENDFVDTEHQILQPGESGHGVYLSMHSTRTSSSMLSEFAQRFEKGVFE